MQHPEMVLIYSASVHHLIVKEMWNQSTNPFGTINHWESYLSNTRLFDVLGYRGSRYIRFQQRRGE